EAFVARREAMRLLVVPQRREALEKLVLHATNLRIPIVEVEGGTVTALAGFDGHQGIALVVGPRRYATVEEIVARAKERSEPPCGGAAISSSASRCAARLGPSTPRSPAPSSCTRRFPSAERALVHPRRARPGRSGERRRLPSQGRGHEWRQKPPRPKQLRRPRPTICRQTVPRPAAELA